MKHLLFNAADVRNELYGVWNQIQEGWNEHLFSWSKSPEGHRKPCDVCERYKARHRGVEDAIRHFGGRPRR
jgi:hypothetical protein